MNAWLASIFVLLGLAGTAHAQANLKTGNINASGTLIVTGQTSLATGGAATSMGGSASVGGTFTSVGATSLASGGGTTTIGGVLNMGGRQINSLANGTLATDAAAFGQIGSAVNTAVSGTVNTIPKFTGTNAIGNSSATDNGTTFAIGEAATINGTGTAIPLAVTSSSTAQAQVLLSLAHNKTAAVGDTAEIDLGTNGTQAQIYTQTFNAGDLSGRLVIGTRWFNGTNYTNTDIDIESGITTFGDLTVFNKTGSIQAEALGSGADTAIEIKNTSTGGRDFLIDSGGNASGAPNVLSIYDQTGGTFRAKFGATSTTINNLATDTLTLHGVTSIDGAATVNNDLSVVRASGTQTQFILNQTSIGSWTMYMSASSKDLKLFGSTAGNSITVNGTTGVLTESAGIIDSGNLTIGSRTDFGKAGAVSYTSITNSGVLDYDTTNHNVVLAAQNSAGTSHVLLSTSNTANAATQLDVGPTGVSVPGTLDVTGATFTEGGGTTTIHVVDKDGTARPTLSTCGTSPSVAGNDASGVVTTGTGATACTITFNTAYGSNVGCSIRGQGAADPTVGSITTTAITLSAAAASTKYFYECRDH